MTSTLRLKRVFAVSLAITVVAGCGSSDSSTGAASEPTRLGTSTDEAQATVAESATTPVDTATWISDLDKIDAVVRERHDDPFSVVSEADWSARLAELKGLFPAATPDERIVGMASLLGLLDSHTQFFNPDQVMYEVLLYRFSDGVFVIAASDPSMVGWRLESINGTSVVDIEALLQPLIPADNESAFLNATCLMADVSYLHGLGVVDDLTKPGFLFSKPDGSQVSVDLPSADVDDFFEAQHAVGSLVGDQNEAVERRSEPIWWRVDGATGSFLLALNAQSSDGRTEALAAMTDALDTGAADHVVVDMRYLGGGDGSLLLPVVDALSNDPRINTPGGLTVLIGRENLSAATVIAWKLDTETAATFVGEMTPARADNFLCNACQDNTLPESGYVVQVPDSRSGNGDTRMAIEPDVALALSSVDFFAGNDPALATALAQ